MNETFEIKEGTVPEKVSTRTSEPNPFEGKFPTEGHGTPDQKSMVIDLPSGTKEEKAYVNKVRNWAQAAARDTRTEDAPKGYSARVLAKPLKVGNKNYTRLTIWSVERIFREGAGRRKSGGNASE